MSCVQSVQATGCHWENSLHRSTDACIAFRVGARRAALHPLHLEYRSSATLGKLKHTLIFCVVWKIFKLTWSFAAQGLCYVSEAAVHA